MMRAHISDSRGSVTVTFSDAELRTLNEALKQAAEFCEMQMKRFPQSMARNHFRKAALDYRTMAVKILGAS